MTEAEKIADRICRGLPNIKSGTLRFWGSWFGRPHDNWHQVVACEASDLVLRVRFNEGEVLSVWSPRGGVFDDRTFRIQNAQRVRWEWFYYGRPKIADNLYFEDFSRSGVVVIAETNVDWYVADLQPDGSEAAVEIL